MNILLIAGLWLGASAWDEVASALGERAVPVSLPGLGDGATGATLEDQVNAVVAAVDAAEGPVVVVGHSAACTLAWLAADRRPERVARVVLVGGFPAPDGRVYNDIFPIVDGAMPFPSWDLFDEPDIADLDEAARKRMESVATPVPEGVVRGVIRYTDERRFEVPVVVVCPEFSPAEATKWIEGGEVPELAKAKNVELADIESGHWPMFTKPAELARLLASVAGDD